MDIVGFTKRRPPIQLRLAQELTAIVRSTQAYKAAKSKRENNPRFIPTGDGMAIVFLEDDNRKAPLALKCACEVASQIYSRNQNLPKTVQFNLRMGIHHQYGFLYTDINDNLNIAGAAINWAQRVMDCGENDHILASEEAVKDFESLNKCGCHTQQVEEKFFTKHGEPFFVYLLTKGVQIGKKDIPSPKGHFRLVETREKCYQEGTALIKHSDEIYSMMCFPEEYKTSQTKYQSKYLRALHEASKKHGKKVHRLLNLSVPKIRDYVQSSLLKQSGEHIEVADTKCEFVDLLIGENQAGGSALITFPTNSLTSETDDPSFIHWGILIKGHRKLLISLKDWYTNRLVSGQVLKGKRGIQDLLVQWVQSRERS